MKTPETTERDWDGGCSRAAPLLAAIDADIKDSERRAYECAKANMDQLFQYWAGRANGLKAAKKIVTANAKVSDPRRA